MSNRDSPPAGLSEKALGRAVSRARHLLEPDEEVEAAAIVQRGLKPLYALVLMGIGAGLFVPGLTSPEDLVPDAVRFYVGLPLFLAGALLMAIPGQALVVLTAGTVYVVSRPPFPGLSTRLLADAPRGALEVDLERGLATVAGLRLWALTGRASSLRELAAAASGAPLDPARIPPGVLRRRGGRLAGLIGALIVAALVLDSAVETDAEEIERVITEYNGDLFRGRGEEACSALSPRAQRELVQEAAARLAKPLDPSTCREQVEAGAARLSDTTRDREADRPAILDIDVHGDRASARVGAPFTYERIPLTRESSGWKLTTVRAAAVVRDAPPGDPPSPADFAARAEGVCRNSARLAVPAAARRFASPDPLAAKASADLLAQRSRIDRALADALSSLTPPVGREGEAQLMVDALRKFAGARDRLGEAVAAQRSGATEQASRSAVQAKQSYRAAVKKAGLEIALNDCL